MADHGPAPDVIPRAAGPAGPDPDRPHEHAHERTEGSAESAESTEPSSELVTAAAPISTESTTKSSEPEPNPVAGHLARIAPRTRTSARSSICTLARVLKGPWPPSDAERARGRLDDFETTPPAVHPFEIRWHKLTADHVAYVRSELEAFYAPQTANRHMATLRSILKAAWRAGLIAGDELERITDVRPIPGKRLQRGRDVSYRDQVKVFEANAAKAGPVSTRNAAILSLAFVAGLRRSELVGLDLADYDPETGRIVVVGKGNKQREWFLDNEGADAMADWLTVRGAEPGPLFYRAAKGGRLIPERLSAQAIYKLCVDLAADAKVKTFTPHDSRRTFISAGLRQGVDLATMQRAAGHSSPATTSLYDRRGVDAMRRAASLLHVPYTRPES